MLLKKVQSLLSKHISFSHYSYLFCSVNLNVPKMLHWFDWGSSKLNLYDISNYRKEQVNLVLQNPIASYSRSVMSKEGNIYLLGGQDNQGYKKTLHVYNLKPQKNPLNFQQLSSMPNYKIDIQTCIMNDEIFVIGGKDVDGKILNTVEAYSIKKNIWYHLNPC